MIQIQAVAFVTSLIQYRSLGPRVPPSVTCNINLANYITFINIYILYKNWHTFNEMFTNRRDLYKNINLYARQRTARGILGNNEMENLYYNSSNKSNDTMKAMGHSTPVAIASRDGDASLRRPRNRHQLVSNSFNLFKIVLCS